MTIHDLTIPMSMTSVVWQGDPPVSLVKEADIALGDDYTLTRINISAHTGTHVDAPAHFVAGGKGMETLDLNILVGPALVVDVSDVAQLSAAILETLAIPPGTLRILFRTQNTIRQLLHRPEFSADFVGVEADAAQWLVQRGIRLVGVDYLSVAPFSDIKATHDILLEAGVIPVEGLDLTDVAPGLYQFICLPLKIVGCDGAPARAILIS